MYYQRSEAPNPISERVKTLYASGKQVVRINPQPPSVPRLVKIVFKDKSEELFQLPEATLTAFQWQYRDAQLWLANHLRKDEDSEGPAG